MNRSSIFKMQVNYVARSILIIDRDEITFFTINKICIKNKINCHYTPDPHVGDFIARTYSPSAILLNGDFAPQLLNLKKEYSAFTNLPIIILAEEAWEGTTDELIIALVNTGAHDFLAKPINDKKLLTVLKRLFSGRELIYHSSNIDISRILNKKKNMSKTLYRRNLHYWQVVNLLVLDAVLCLLMYISVASNFLKFNEQEEILQRGNNTPTDKSNNKENTKLDSFSTPTLPPIRVKFE